MDLFFEYTYLTTIPSLVDSCKIISEEEYIYIYIYI